MERGDILAVLETSKASFELEAEQAGFCFTLIDEGTKIAVQGPVGLIFPENNGDRELKTVERYKKESSVIYPKRKEETGEGPRLTKKAMLLAEKHNIDVSKLPADRIIREADLIILIPKK